MSQYKEIKHGVTRPARCKMGGNFYNWNNKKMNQKNIKTYLNVIIHWTAVNIPSFVLFGFDPSKWSEITQGVSVFLWVFILIISVSNSGKE